MYESCLDSDGNKPSEKRHLGQLEKFDCDWVSDDVKRLL